MDFRQAAGKKLQWLDTGLDKGFSNFLFVDQHYSSNPVLRRIFSLARKHTYPIIATLRGCNPAKRKIRGP